MKGKNKTLFDATKNNCVIKRYMINKGFFGVIFLSTQMITLDKWPFLYWYRISYGMVYVTVKCLRRLLCIHNNQTETPTMADIVQGHFQILKIVSFCTKFHWDLSQ